MAMGLGLTVGPVFGAIVFQYLSFNNGMFVFAVIVLSTGCYAVSLLSDKLDKGSNKDKKIEECHSLSGSLKLLYQEETAPVQYSLFLLNGRSRAALIAYGVATMSLVFLNPILTINLLSLGLEQRHGGYGFATLALAFGAGAPVLGRVC
jgi:hypothetical protein